MINSKRTVSNSFSSLSYLSILISASILTACGGDSPQVSNAVIALPPAEVATGTTTLEMSVPVLPPDVAALNTQPTFHLAPVLLDAPADTDAIDGSRSARMPAAMQAIPREWQGVRGRGLTVSAIRSLPRPQFTPAPIAAGQGDVLPSAGTGVVSTFTPAQIRTAYGMPTLPASLSSLTTAQAAQLGAGQTIYIVNAKHDPNIVAELNAFNQKFGLPACTVKSIAANATLPLAAASSAAGCEFSVVFSTSAGSMSSSTPAYDSGWATEIALDVQWAHATAPLARIILIEATDSSMSNMVGGIRLANAMGPGVVSMSFGSSEGSWTAGVESTFTTAKMTYLAASGDNGPAVEWPAVSPNVVAVGGTSLTYSGSSRTEVAWANTGGGVSAYTATPAYQNTTVPGMGAPARRTVADVSMNSDPNTGQYVAVMTPGSSTVNWVSAGGTSLATPQWAGIIAVANATLVQAGKTVLGAPHAVLYNKISSVPGSYASVFADVAKGSNGSCTVCTAKTGYDQLTGLGSPNVNGLLSALSGTVIANPPAVTSASINGQVGTALSFTVSAIGDNALAYTLSGNPAGMSVSSAGAVTWAAPVAGTYTVTATATDSKTGLSGKGTYTVVITAPTSPVVTAATINGTAATALSFNVTATSANAMTYGLSGAPAGMSISATGTVSWAAPVTGTYSVTVSATDSKNGLTGKAVYTVVIAQQAAPVVTAASVSGTVGTALTYTVAVKASNALSYTLTGAPAGMAISSTGVITWVSPVAGNYAVTVVAKDSKTGLSGQAVITISVAASGLSITAPAITGSAGKALTGNISISAPGATSLSISITGAPLGLGFAMSGLNIALNWTSPVKGSYTMVVTVTDSLGRKATANVPITIN
ncbi:putative Ig domain-containing protein [Undibacterium sp. Tian12W]|uniref:putative Ig domain-containing protein n=1 Tax=Undibacterium sp. Tian12W TaxID=3413054 RepID=UPI003BF1D022